MSYPTAEEVDMKSVEYLVLDEVDSLLQLGFEAQVHQVVERLPAVHQKMFFSATVPPRIEKMASEWLQDPLHVLVGEVCVCVCAGWSQPIFSTVEPLIIIIDH